MLNIAVFLILVIGIGFFQCFLSRNDSRWLGLILPAIALCYAILAVLGMTAYNGPLTTVFMAFAVFLVTNIPTGILLAIYFACRQKTRAQLELSKMELQDLE